MAFNYYALYWWVVNSFHSFRGPNRIQSECVKSKHRTMDRLSGMQALENLHFSILYISYKSVTGKSHLK